MIGAFLRLVPSSVWIGLATAVALIVALFALDHAAEARGAARVQLAWDKDKVRVAEELAAAKKVQIQVVEKVVTQYVDRVKVIKEKGDEIVKQVPVFIPIGGCELPGAWRVLHDSAVRGDFPQDPERAIATAKPVDGATAAEVVASNYAACHSDQARLAALQQLVAQLQPQGGDP